MVMGIAEKNLWDKPEAFKSESNLEYLNWTKIKTSDYSSQETHESSTETKITEEGIPFDLIERMKWKQDMLKEW